MTHRLRRGLGRVAAAAALTGACIAASAAPNLIVNGDFDDTNGTWHDNTDLGGDDVQLGGTPPPGWSSMPGLANDIWIGPNNGYQLTASPRNGSDYFLDLTGQRNSQPFGGVEQTIATVPGAVYLITYELGESSIYNDPDDGLAQEFMQVRAVGNTTQMSGEFGYVVAGTNQWAPYFFRFTAQTDSTTIQFLADPYQVDSQYVGLDNVAVTLVSPPPVTTVPEPAEFAMLLSGLGLVGGLARSRRR